MIVLAFLDSEVAELDIGATKLPTGNGILRCELISVIRLVLLTDHTVIIVPLLCGYVN